MRLGSYGAPLWMALLLGGAIVGCGGGGSSQTPSTPTQATPTPAPTPTPIPNPGVSSGVSSRFLYTLDTSHNKIFSYRVDSSTGTLFPGFSASLGGESRVTGASLAVQGNHLYVPNALDNSIDAYEIQTDGRLNSIQAPLGLDDDSGSLVAMRVTPNGLAAYAVDNSGTIFPLVIDADTGQIQANGAPVSTGLAPNPLNGSAGLTTPAPLLIAPGGGFLYLAGGGQMAAFTVSTHGTLQAAGQVSCPSVVQLATDPAGRFLYAVDSTNNQIHQFSLSAAGVPVPLSAATVPTGRLPAALVVEPAGKFAYCGSVTDSTITQYQIGSNGALTQVGAAVQSTTTNVGRLTVDASGRFLYASESSNALVATVNAIQRYNIAGDGTLTADTTIRDTPDFDPELQFSSGSTPATTTPQAAYVLNGTNVSAFAIGTSGPLSALNTEAAAPPDAFAGTPRNLALVTLPGGGRTLYVGFDNSVTRLDLNSDGSLGAAVATIAGAPDPIKMLVDPTQQYLLILSQSGGSHSVIEVFVILADGSLQSLENIDTGAGDGSGMTIDNTGSYLYVTDNPDSGGVLAPFFLEGDGQVSPGPVSALTAGSATFGVATVPTAPLVMTSDSLNGQIDTFFNSVVMLSPLGSTSTGISPRGLATDPLGRFLFADIVGSVPHVAAFQVVPGQGTVVPVSGIFGTAGTPTALSTDPLGQFLYVATSSDNGSGGSVAQYTINSNGGLTALSPATVALPSNAVDIVTTGITK